MEEVYIIDGNEYTLAEIQDFASGVLQYVKLSY